MSQWTLSVQQSQTERVSSLAVAMQLLSLPPERKVGPVVTCSRQPTLRGSAFLNYDTPLNIKRITENLGRCWHRLSRWMRLGVDILKRHMCCKIQVPLRVQLSAETTFVSWNSLKPSGSEHLRLLCSRKSRNVFKASMLVSGCLALLSNSFALRLLCIWTRLLTEPNSSSL